MSVGGAEGGREVVRVVIWNEYRHERSNAEVAALYPDGIHGAIRDGLSKEFGAKYEISVATLDEPEAGLPDGRLAETDVLIWWGHRAHAEVPDEVAERVQRHVLEGMGLIVLHSGHFSKVFKRLMGTHCSLRWRVSDVERERIWNLAPGHPITRGIGEYFEIPHAEMYGERFDIPDPDELVFLSWFSGGEVFRSGCVWRRGHGKVFYFRPGHETYPIYYQEEVLRVIGNAVGYVRATIRREDACPMAEAPEG